MKKNIINIAIAGVALAGMTACSDYLDVKSPSEVDADFVFSNSVTARGALDGAYETWRDAAQNAYFGDGLYYAADIAGSDIERHPEAFTNQPGRHYPECFYQNGNYAGEYNLLSYLKEGGVYDKGFAVVGKANSIITAMQNAENFDEIVTNATEPSALSQMYGEAVAMRATAYRELIKYWGDVPFAEKFGDVAYGVTSRDSIYDKIIADLIEVEPLMFPVGKIPNVDATKKNYFSQTYVEVLIGRLCLEAAGYQTRRTDLGSDFYKDGNGNVLTFEKLGTDHNNATYGRRSDYAKFYDTAITYFTKALNNLGTAKFYETDPRSADANGNRVYNNPYQYFFQQMHEDDAAYADESIYEYPQQQGGGNDGRPYSFGRPSSGGSKAAYPCKSYGQGRINPAFYYGIFDPNDKRRDVSCTVTGSDGKGYEKLISFAGGSKADAGGISLNKWDECRQTTPWVAAQRKSGINGPYMRTAEVYLGLAEAYAAKGNTQEARTYLMKTRNRAFDNGGDVDAFIAKCGSDTYLNSSECAKWNSTFLAVIEERGFEYAGEGDRRWTLIRTGLIGGAVHRVKDMTKKMLDGLAKNGYYTFDNGNTISNKIWTKMVDAKAEKGFRLTAQCTDVNDPVLYPGWRGQNDSWESYGCTAYTKDSKTNLAIKGLFNYIAPGSAEAQALEADGYTMVDWASNITEKEYYTNLFLDYDYVSAPIYLWPFTPNTLSTGGFTNGYGFKQE